MKSNKLLLLTLSLAVATSTFAADEIPPMPKESYQAPWTPRNMDKKYKPASDPFKFDDSNTMNLHSSYTDTFEEMKKKNYKESLKDYNIKSDETANSTAKLQTAIDDISNGGGGVLYVTPGTYRLKGLKMRSNVHIAFDKGVIIRPFLDKKLTGNKSKAVMINFGGKTAADLIENCSIRCAQKGERYSVRYDDYLSLSWPIFASAISVYNFSIADVNIYDNITCHCGFGFGATSEFIYAKDGTKLSSPTRGQMIDCSIFNSHPGYGLLQTGSGKDLYFENLYSLGGVTLRHEIGGETEFTGVDNMRSRNIRNENGYCALLVGPHLSKNGTILADGIWSKGSCYTINLGNGKRSNDGRVGTFASDSKIINVEGVLGRHTSVLADKELWTYNPRYYCDLVDAPADMHNGGKFSIGSSNGVIRNDCENTYNMKVEGVRATGFEPQYVEIYISDFNLPEKFNGFDTRNKLGLK